ncbi:predicted protein [Nematostella vectensis]|uniref:Uncharacterized protein n=1 Tax=Nematostella vectensis TaxID=45351 RepID=A7SEB8_NEMVE|nr:predicted protein [Nematostella vectensis]|eukprot:XP_001629961.1 predicted protein [Nematostella vectensis]
MYGCKDVASQADATDEQTEKSKLLREIREEVLKWTDCTDSKLSDFLIKYAHAQKMYGTALKLLLKQNSEGTAARGLDDSIIQLCDKMGLKHCAIALRESLPIKYPNDFQPF